ncbi:MAG: O-antigen ligase family protein [Bacteroidales bacterium]|jgi:O-antigen ligase|nr:O-antigen ligase family protein [Bacteroidales bacterium]
MIRKGSFYRMIYPAMLLCCFTVTFPVVFKVFSLLFLFIALSGSFNFKQTKELICNKTTFSFFNPLFVLMFFYVLYCLGMIYTSDIQYGLFDLQIKLVMFLLPFLLLFVPKELWSKEKMWCYAKVFIAGLLIIMVYLITIGFVKAFSGDKFNITPLTYSSLAGGIAAGPTYLAFAINIAIILIFKMPLSNKLTLKQSRAVKTVVIGFLTLFFMFMNSRTGLLGFVVVNMVMLIDSFLNRRKYLLLVLVLYQISVGIVFTNISLLNRRFTFTTTIDRTGKDGGAAVSAQERAVYYTQYPKMLVKNLPFGTGTGDTKHDIMTFVDKENIVFSRYNHSNVQHYLNAHNQFLQTGIAIGLLGLATLIWLHLLFVIKFCNKKQWWLITLIAVCGISLMFESMLERQQGVYYFAYLICFLSPLIHRKANH